MPSPAHSTHSNSTTMSLSNFSNNSVGWGFVLECSSSTPLWALLNGLAIIIQIHLIHLASSTWIRCCTNLKRMVYPTMMTYRTIISHELSNIDRYVQSKKISRSKDHLVLATVASNMIRLCFNFINNKWIKKKIDSKYQTDSIWHNLDYRHATRIEHHVWQPIRTNEKLFMLLFWHAVYGALASEHFIHTAPCRKLSIWPLLEQGSTQQHKSLYETINAVYMHNARDTVLWAMRLRQPQLIRICIWIKIGKRK